MPSEPLDEPKLTALLRIEAKQVHRDPLLMALAVSPFLALPVVWLAAILRDPGLMFFTLPLCILGAVATRFVLRRNPWRHERRVRIEVDAEALWVGELVVPRERIKRGLRTPVAGKSEVWLSRTGLALDLQLVMKSAKHAQALLVALGLDAAQSVASFWTVSRTYEGEERTIFTLLAVVGPTAILAVLAAFVGVPLAMSVVLVGVLAALTLLLAPMRVEVGADGVMLSWLGTRRFVSHGDVEGVTTKLAGGSSAEVVQLSLANGRTVVIPTNGADSAAWRAGSLVERILDARAVFRRTAVEPQVLLQRGHRPHAAWVRALRAREVVDWRSPAVQNDVLWRVIEDASASPVERAAAAVALGRELTPDERERLGHAAHATAVPKLRIALETAVDAEDVQLASMLEGLEEKSRLEAP